MTRYFNHNKEVGRSGAERARLVENKVRYKVTRPEHIGY